VTVTLPQLAANTSLEYYQAGTGTVSFVAGSGVTLRFPVGTSASIATQFGSVGVYYVSSTVVELSGTLTGPASGVPIQSGLVSTGSAYTIKPTDLGVFATGALTATLPTSLPTVAASWSYMVKNGTNGLTVTVSAGTGKIDNFTGGINVSSETLTVAGQVKVYVPDPRTAGDFLRS